MESYYIYTVHLSENFKPATYLPKFQRMGYQFLYDFCIQILNRLQHSSIHWSFWIFENMGFFRYWGFWFVCTQAYPQDSKLQAVYGTLLTLKVFFPL